jgi:hypothetical protein
MMVNAIRCPTSNMHATMRQFHCTARCRLPLMQADRSLCMTTMCVGMSSTTCAFCQESLEGTHRKYTCRLSAWIEESPVQPLSGRLPQPNGGGDHGGKPEMAAQACAGSVAACAIACRKQRARSDRGTTQSETCYSPLSISRSSRNGSALGGAEASCRIAP